MDIVCSICSSAIIANNQFVCCSNCGLFFHIICAGVTEKFYKDYIVERRKLWYCHVCYTNNQGQNYKNVTKIAILSDESSASKNSNVLESSLDHDKLTNNFNEQIASTSVVSKVPTTIQSETHTNISLKDVFEEGVCIFINGATNLVNLAANSCILRCLASNFRNNATE